MKITSKNVNISRTESQVCGYWSEISDEENLKMLITPEGKTESDAALFNDEI